MSRPNPWTAAVVEHLTKTREPMSMTEIRSRFGSPLHRANLFKRLDGAVASGYLTKSWQGKEAFFAATGRLPQHYPATTPSWAAVGRNAPRVASIFHYAQGVRA